MKSLAVCSVLADEPDWLAEWLEHHASLGVDHFIIYRVPSAPRGRLLDQMAGDTNRITVIEWSETPAQQTAYQHFCKELKSSYEWTCFIDTTEFICVSAGQTITNHLRAFDQYSAMLVNWLLFDQNRTLRLADSAPVHRLVRSFVRNRDLQEPDVSPHTFRLSGSVCDAMGNAARNVPMQENPRFDPIVVARLVLDLAAQTESQLVRDMRLSARVLEQEGVQQLVSSLTQAPPASLFSAGIPANPVDIAGGMPPNPDLLSQMPAGLEAVLDVGCGTGSLAAAYRVLSPSTLLLGIDRDPDAVANAASHFDRIALADVEQQAFPFEADHELDCIVYGDVLQMLSKPWRILQEQANFLRPGGLVLICIPNMDHWSVADHLIRGTWRHEESGVLDHRHIRWFNLNTVIRGVQQCGLCVTRIHPRVFDQDQARNFVQKMLPTLPGLGISGDLYSRRAAPLQYVISAIREH